MAGLPLAFNHEQDCGTHRWRDADKPAIVAIRTNDEVYQYLGGPAGPDFADELADATVGEQWGGFCIADSATGR